MLSENENSYFIINDNSSLYYKNLGEENYQLSYVLNTIKIDDQLYKTNYIDNRMIRKNEKLIKRSKYLNSLNDVFYRLFRVNKFDQSQYFIGSSNLVKINVPGDGSCFYHAIALSLGIFGIVENSTVPIMKRIRKQLADKLVELDNPLITVDMLLNSYKPVTIERINAYNPRMFYGEFDNNPDNYVANICKEEICNLNREGEIESLIIPLQLLYNVNILYIVERNGEISIGNFIEFNPLLYTIILHYEINVTREQYLKNYNDYINDMETYFSQRNLSIEWRDKFYSVSGDLFEVPSYRNFVYNLENIPQEIREAIKRIKGYKSRIPLGCQPSGHYQVIGVVDEIVARTLFPPGNNIVLNFIAKYDEENGTNYLKQVNEILVNN